MLLYISIATFCLITTAHSAENSSEIPNDAAASNNTTEDERDEYFPALDWSDTFDWQLLKAVSEQSSKNVLISPLSIKLALLMLYEGSTGLTEKQLQSVLKFPPKKSEVREKYKYLLEALQDNRKHYILNIGTRLFLDSSIKPQQLYASTIKSAYDADIQPTNFTDKTDTSEIINSWIDIVTNGRIREFIQAEDILDDTLLLVSNAVYFKGHWRQEFLKNNTYSAGFYVSPTETVTVQYMKNTDKYYYVESKELDAKILRLPYEGKHFGLFFVLPNSKGGLPQLLKNANLATIKRQLYLLDERTVDIAIPKFKFEFTSHYAKILQEFGLSTIFSNSASFPGIARGVGSGTKWLFVNDIKQKAGIEINEEGSTVYGVTDIQLGNKFRETDLSFNATHPFLIFLEDQTTGSILFAGKVVNPLQTESVIENSVTEEPESTSKPVFENAVVQSDNFPPLQLNPVGQQQENTLTPRFNYFDLELVQSFDDRQNYFISPASIKATLGMVLEGARGQCAKEIGAALRIPVDQAGSRDKLRSLLYDFNTKSESTFIESANGAFVSNVYRVLPEYKRNLKEYYKAEVVPLNFSNVEAAASYMNTWVKDVTRGLITDIITTENFNSDATLVIANALYFKGKWKSEFDEKSTSLQCFKSSRSSCIHAKMMQNVDKFRYKFIEDIDAQAIELPYGDEQYAMLVLLPSEKNSVDGVQRDLQFIPFASIVNRLEKTEVSLTLPKFEIDYSADIVADLQRLGIKEIFGPKANLSGIIADAQIKINNIVHQAKVEVNEKGTVAAGATGVIVIPLMGTSTPRFIADRPFLFFIYNRNSKNILFAGRFNNPKETYDEIFGGPTSFSSNTQNRKYAVPNKDAVALSLENQGNKQGTKSKPSYAAVAAQPIYFQQDTVTQPRESSNYQIFRSSPYNRNYDNYREPFSENGGAFVNQ